MARIFQINMHASLHVLYQSDSKDSYNSFFYQVSVRRLTVNDLVLQVTIFTYRMTNQFIQLFP